MSIRPKEGALEANDGLQSSMGSVDAVASHLRGLAKIKEIQDEDGAPGTMGLLQRMILMYEYLKRHLQQEKIIPNPRL